MTIAGVSGREWKNLPLQNQGIVMPKKDRLLLYLKEKRDSWISGEMLSKEIGVSRSAVWKHIRRLKEDGYEILSSPKKGYLLRKDSELLLPNEIREGLRTRVLGKRQIHYLREVDSTNLKAKLLAEKGASEGTVVVAEEQSAGRGRRGRRWFSSPGNGIYMSLILRPSISPIGAPRITLMTAVAVAEALLAEVDLDVRIKWPNDLLVRGRKLVGILTEINTEMDAVNYIVVGIGMNVNTPAEDFPEEIREIATSIFRETGKRFSRIRLVKACLEQFETYYEMFKENRFPAIIRRWKELARIVGQRITVDVLGKEYAGQVVEIDADGVLILRDDRGGIHRIISGDVTL
ncbi:MAG: biotin--[acetyl-CoA-carboxylase] ligase [Deltaproteobacteria bacterium]|nr:MAG: biotin--[acetyl-CoA-carboxylase] ligase [Deltaproteobacteria bacterium]